MLTVEDLRWAWWRCVCAANNCEQLVAEGDVDVTGHMQMWKARAARFRAAAEAMEREGKPDGE